METIKQSFAKNFLPVFIFSLIMGAVSSVLGLLGTLGSLASLIALPPMYIGFYSFLFKRMEDENPDISSIFNFYKSGQTFGKSFLMYNLGGLVLGAIIMVVVLSMITSILVTLSTVGTSAKLPGGTVGALLIVALLLVIAAIFFNLMPYLYAYNKNIEVGWSLKTSFKLGAKYIYVFLGINILFGILSIIVAFISLGVTSLNALAEFARTVSETRDYTPSTGFLSTIIGWVISAGSKWATFTAAYMIFQREGIQRENLDDMYRY